MSTTLPLKYALFAHLHLLPIQPSTGRVSVLMDLAGIRSSIGPGHKGYLSPPVFYSQLSVHADSSFLMDGVLLLWI